VETGDWGSNKQLAHGRGESSHVEGCITRGASKGKRMKNDGMKWKVMECGVSMFH
jgi:hypothetical protein